MAHFHGLGLPAGDHAEQMREAADQAERAVSAAEEDLDEGHCIGATRNLLRAGQFATAALTHFDAVDLASLDPDGDDFDEASYQMEDAEDRLSGLSERLQAAEQSLFRTCFRPGQQPGWPRLRSQEAENEAGTGAGVEAGARPPKPATGEWRWDGAVEKWMPVRKQLLEF